MGLDTYNIIKTLSSNGVLDQNMHTTTLLVQGIALAVAPLLFVVNIMHNFWGTTTSFMGQVFNKKELLRLWVVYGFIVLYPAIFTPVMFVVDVVNKASAMDSKAYDDYVTMMEKYSENAMNYSKSAQDNSLPVDALKENEIKHEPTQGGEVFQDMFSFFITSPLNVINSIINAVVIFVAGIVHLLIGIVCVYLFKILYILGPMAFCFSLSPFSTNQVDIWLGTFLNTGLTLFTMNILQKLLINNLVASVASVGTVATTNTLTDATFGIVIIILYLCVFWLTSKFVGIGDGGKVLSTAMQAVQTMAQGRMAMNGSGSGGADSAAGDAARAGGDSIKKQ